MHEQFEKLMAFRDGELPPAEEAKVEELLATDPEARRLMLELESADREFSRAAQRIIDEPVPQRLLDTVRESGQGGKVVNFPRRRAIVGLAVAAGLTAILLTGTQTYFNRGAPTGDFPLDSRLAELLQQALEKTPSGQIRSSDSGLVQVMPRVTYRTADAVFCREYMALQDGAELGGLACRQPGGTWEVISQQAMATSGDGAYRAAEGTAEEELRAPQLDGATTLSYARETAAIRSSWSPSGQ